MFKLETERKRKREKETERDRQTDRQSDRQTDRQTEAETDRQTDRHKRPGRSYIVRSLTVHSVQPELESVGSF